MYRTDNTDIKNGYGVHIWNLHVDKVINFKKVRTIQCEQMT